MNTRNILILLVLINLSCTEDRNQENANNNQIEIPQSYNALTYDIGVYRDYFKKSENTVGFSSLKPNSLQEPNVVQQSILSKTAKQHTIYFGNGNIEPVSAKANANDYKNIFGTNISIKTYNPMSRTTDVDTTMYVPHLLEITNPEVETAEQQFPVCYYEDFVLEWNADPNNKEGLVVIADYYGENAISRNSTNQRIVNMDVIDVDNGMTTLNTELFKDMPDLSFVTLILLRGNVVIEQVDGEIYKFYAETHVRLPIILLRDINSLIVQ